MAHKKRSTADYYFITIFSGGRDIISITDLNKGNMSVTNDIENVVKDIFDNLQTFPNNCLIIYRDSRGVWDGYDHKSRQFVPLHELTPVAAIKKYVIKQLILS